jgi:hypothetical protein
MKQRFKQRSKNTDHIQIFAIAKLVNLNKSYQNQNTMTRTIKTMILIGFFSFINLKGYSQVSISYYSSSLSKIGLGYNFGDRFWGEFRLYSNTKIGDITPELVFCFNIVHKEKTQYLSRLRRKCQLFYRVRFAHGRTIYPNRKV